MTKKNNLRKWQKDALDVYFEAKAKNEHSILWEATPGAGKTVAAIQLCLHELQNHGATKVIVIVPTSHLKLQWARAAAGFNLHLDTNYGEKQKVLAKDYQGAVLTYQQLGNKPRGFGKLATNSVIILDEVHHAGDGLTWGNSLRLALKDSSFILCLSGTAFRSDNNSIPYVKYSPTGVSHPDYVYSYASAISDRVCRPTVFFTYGGDVTWQDAGQLVNASFSDALEKTGRTKRLRAALDHESGWIEPMLMDANTMISAIRSEHQDAGALLVTANQKHAKELSKVLMKVTGEKPITVLSDDPSANKKLKDFTSGNERWLVACNMVSEGVDIPRLRIGVFATTVRTKMYFRQFLGRIVRKTKTPSGIQPAFFYLPADPWLKQLAEEIEEEQRHYLKSAGEELWLDGALDSNKEKREEKESTWQALKSTNSGLESVISGGGQLSLWGNFNDPQDSSQLITSLGLPQFSAEAESEKNYSKAELKEEIAKEIRTLVTRYHKNSGQPHSHIHSLLNKTQGLKSQNQCTEKQLRERLNLLEKLIHHT